MTVPQRTIPETKLDAALSALFQCFEGSEVRLVVKVDGKRVGEWAERRQITDADASAVKHWLEGA